MIDILVNVNKIKVDNCTQRIFVSIEVWLNLLHPSIDVWLLINL